MDALSSLCSCEDKTRCVVLTFLKGLRLEAFEVDHMIHRSTTMVDTTSSSRLCNLFSLVRALELNFCDNLVPPRKPPTKWQEIELGYSPFSSAMRVLSDVTLSRCTRVSVEGYNTLLPHDLVKRSLEKHFLGCGEICDVVIPENQPCCGVIYFWEQGAEDKALALSGTLVPGDNSRLGVEPWNVIVKPLPKKLCEFSLDQVAAALRDQHFHLYHSRSCLPTLCVTGYDTGLPEDKVKSALFKLFSSCGEIIYLGINKAYPSNHLKSSGNITIWGEGAKDKARALSGSDVGGWNVVVKEPQLVEAPRERPRACWPGPSKRRNVTRGAV